MDKLFDDIHGLTRLIEVNRRDLDLRNICYGQVMYVNSNNYVKVIDINSKENYVSHWLRPSKEIVNVTQGDFVLYTYPTRDLSQGIYFQVFNRESLNEPSFITLEMLDEALTVYDSGIKTYITSQNFLTIAYDATIKAWINTELLKYSSKYILFNAYRLDVGNIVAPSTWIDKQISFGVTNVAGTFNIKIVINATNNNWFGGANKLYFKNTFSSTAIPLLPQDGISINALAINTEFSMTAQKQWEIKKGTSNTNYSVTEVSYTFNPY